MADAADVTSLLPRDGIKLGLAPADRWEAVRRAGETLVAVGAVEDGYVDAMREREEMVSSFVGAGFAIPHGTNEARSLVRRASLVFLQYPDGIDWDGQDVHVAVGIAAAEDEHVAVMSRLAQVLLDADVAERLRTTDDPDEVLALLQPDEG